MPSQTSPEGSPGASGIRAILYGGGLAGTLDIVAAFVFFGLRGVTPIQILQSIASGLFGLDSFKGGLRTAAVGLVLQFFIATTAAAVYYAASRRLEFLWRGPVAAGALYGVAVYFFMNFLVVPLSNVPKQPLVLSVAAAVLAIHIFCVGLPIALSVRRFAPRRLPRSPTS